MCDINESHTGLLAAVPLKIRQFTYPCPNYSISTLWVFKGHWQISHVRVCSLFVKVQQNDLGAVLQP